jgi:hypothetical protein
MNRYYLIRREMRKLIHDALDGAGNKADTNYNKRTTRGIFSSDLPSD